MRKFTALSTNRLFSMSSNRNVIGIHQSPATNAKLCQDTAPDIERASDVAIRGSVARTLPQGLRQTANY